ncbi:hypothetical protein AM228_16705 [Planktothricoides sp. SR001]|jgi:hypothetical protein|nr:hypothetical protein AM228_16705 [Planktothricoides sp. SR001]
MLVSSPTDKSAIKINAVGSVVIYSAFILTTICLSAIALGVDLQEALCNAPLLPPPTADVLPHHR